MVHVKKNGGVSFWYSDIGGPPAYQASLAGDQHADVCIVGAGYTGLWTAYYLKKNAPNLHIIIIEKEFAGFGASGRNGGWLSGTFTWNRKIYGKNSSKAAVAAMESSMKGAVAEIIRVAREENIDADIMEADLMNVACSPAQLQRLKNKYQEGLDWGVPKQRIELIDAQEVHQRIRVKNALGASLEHGGARVQPAKLVQGLAKAVRRLGVTIYERTTALEIAKGQVTTNKGIIKAEYIVQATEGFTANIKNRERQLIPLNSAIIVTEPISDALWAEIGWTGYELLGDASHAYCYAQRTRESRIAMGGRGVPYRYGSKTDEFGVTQQATINQLHAIIKRLLPQIAHVPIDQAWCGVLGVPRDWCASVGLDSETKIAWAGGYVGTGVSTTNLAGRTLADLILQRDSEITRHPWVNHKVKMWEPEPLRWLGVHSMYQLYHMADRLEARSGGSKTSILSKFANQLTGR